MPTVKIERKSTRPAQETFTRISGMLSGDKDLRKLDSGYKFEADPSAMTGQATGSMFKAKMNVKDDGGGSKVEITVELPFTLSLMKGMVEKQLAKKLEDVLA